MDIKNIERRVRMGIKDLTTKADAEYAERHRAANRRASPVRLDEEVWARLDRLALELGWSRNRLLTELIDEASFDLAVELSRTDGQLDPDQLAYYCPEVAPEEA